MSVYCNFIFKLFSLNSYKKKTFIFKINNLISIRVKFAFYSFG